MIIRGQLREKTTGTVLAEAAMWLVVAAIIWWLVV